MSAVAVCVCLCVFFCCFLLFFLFFCGFAYAKTYLAGQTPSKALEKCDPTISNAPREKAPINLDVSTALRESRDVLLLCGLLGCSNQTEPKRRYRNSWHVETLLYCIP